MIHVDLQPEPAHFNADVRIPGNRFLARCPNPTNKQWNKERHWKNISSDLYCAYSGICAYTGLWFSKSVTAVSVDHFFPKHSHPEKAYEWDNYRLTTQIMNTYKDEFIIADPFEITNGDIILDFPSCLVKVNPQLPAAMKSKLQFTIDALKLNSSDDQVQARCDIVVDYVNGEINQQHLWKRYPFIAYELQRQNLFERIKDIIKPLQLLSYTYRSL